MSHATAEHPAHLQHHFATSAQQYSSAKLGLWCFLVTEVLLFGGLFVAYIIFRGLYPDLFHEASAHLNKVMGGVNTVVLICSSLTMALAVDATKHNQLPRAQVLMWLTVLCALIFMGVKYFEYAHKFHEGLLPGAHFAFHGIANSRAGLFFSLYFMMTGLHGIHVLVGIGLILWSIRLAGQRRVGAEYFTPVELTGIYWHLVDLIWIYLFPLLYLIG